MERGHGSANAEEAAEIDRLEAQVRAQLPIEELLDLVHPYFEPVHAFEDAIAICDTVLAVDPDNARAKLWRAYGAIFAWPSDEELSRARALLSSITGSKWAGAAWMLLSGLVAHDGPPENVIEYLERSIRAEPGWSANRRLLAARLRKVGRLTEAREELSQAIENLIPSADGLSVVEAAFRWTLTGRLESRAALEDEMNRLDAN